MTLGVCTWWNTRLTAKQLHNYAINDKEPLRIKTTFEADICAISTSTHTLFAPINTPNPRINSYTIHTNQHPQPPHQLIHQSHQTTPSTPALTHTLFIQNDSNSFAAEKKAKVSIMNSPTASNKFAHAAHIFFLCEMGKG